jgi:hypothetical protein
VIRIYLMIAMVIGRFMAQPRKRDERGASAVEWLIVLGAGIGIAYFAGDSVWAFAKGLADSLGGQ